MGSAFAVPCLENKNDVTLVGTHLEDELIKGITSNNNFHPALNTELPIKLKVDQSAPIHGIHLKMCTIGWRLPTTFY